MIMTFAPFSSFIKKNCVSFHFFDFFCYQRNGTTLQMDYGFWYFRGVVQFKKKIINDVLVDYFDGFVDDDDKKMMFTMMATARWLA